MPLMAEIGLDSSGFERGMSRVRGEMNSFASGQLSHLKGALIGAFTVGALETYADQVIQAAHAVEVLSQKSGFSTDAVQRLDYMAKQSNSSFDSMTTQLGKLEVARQKALRDGGGDQAKAFEDLGISLKEVAELNPEQLFYRIADATKEHNAGVTKAADLASIFGKGYADLLPILNQGGEALRSLSESAVVMSEGTLTALSKLEKGTKSFFQNLKAGTAEALVGFYNLAKIGIWQGASPVTTTWQKNKMLGGLGEMFGGAMGEWLGNAAAGAKDVPDESDKRDEAKMRRQRALALAILKQERDLRLAEQTPTDRLTSLDAERAALNKAIGETTDDEQKLKLTKQRLDVEKEIAALKRSESDREAGQMERRLRREAQDAAELAEIRSGRGVRVSAPISDSLTRVGNFVGGTGDYGLKLAEKQLAINEKIEAHTRKMAARDSTGGDLGVTTSEGP